MRWLLAGRVIRPAATEAVVALWSQQPVPRQPPSPLGRSGAYVASFSRRPARTTFRAEQIVYVTLSLDETVMGFARPREEREALVRSDPATLALPSAADLRFHWVHAGLGALGPVEAREFVVDAWRMVLPKKVSAAYDLAHPLGPG